MVLLWYYHPDTVEVVPGVFHCLEVATSYASSSASTSFIYSPVAFLMEIYLDWDYTKSNMSLTRWEDKWTRILSFEKLGGVQMSVQIHNFPPRGALFASNVS